MASLSEFLLLSTKCSAAHRLCVFQKHKQATLEELPRSEVEGHHLCVIKGIVFYPDCIFPRS